MQQGSCGEFYWGREGGGGGQLLVTGLAEERKREMETERQREEAGDILHVS